MAKLLVRTSLGNSILDYGDVVPTFSANNKYFEKPAADLNIGERVLFEKEYITATLDDVEPFLTKSKRYAEAKNALHEINKQGQYIPKLRCLLWRGLQENSPGLEARILLEEQDFSGKEYGAAINTTKETIEAANIKSLTHSGTKNWLDGTTLAPGNWDKFRALEKINPKFSSFKVDESNRQSLFFLYKLYTTVRRGIMHYLDKPNFKHSEEEREDEHKISRISLAEEIDLVLEHFVKDVNKDQALAQVLQIEKIFENEPIYQKARKENTLARGIVRGRGQINENEKIKFKQVVINNGLIATLFSRVLEKIETPEVSADCKGWLGVNIINEYLSNEGENRYGDLRLAGISSLSKYVNDASRFELFAKNYLNKIFDGTLDAELGLNFGTIKRLLDICKQYYQNTPKALIAITEKAYLSGELQAVLDILENNSFIDSEFIRKAVSQFDLEKEFTSAMMGQIEPKIFYLKIKDKIKDLEKSLSNLKERGYKCYYNTTSEKEVDKILDEWLNYSPEQIKNFLFEHDLTDLLKLYPELELSLEEKINAKIKRKSKELKYGGGGFFPQVTEEHNKLVDLVVQNSDLIELGLKFVSKEYVFDVSNNRADILFMDAQNKPLVIEVEQDASDKTGKIGFSQAYIYKNLFMIDYDLPKENVRGMLIARKICENTKKLCEKYDVECKEITEDLK